VPDPRIRETEGVYEGDISSPESHTHSETSNGLERAKTAGATILSVIEEGPPGRRYRAEDLEGHRWFFFETDHA
jgi:hypothetical protein